MTRDTGLHHVGQGVQVVKGSGLLCPVTLSEAC